MRKNCSVLRLRFDWRRCVFLLLGAVSCVYGIVALVCSMMPPNFCKLMLPGILHILPSVMLICVGFKSCWLKLRSGLQNVTCVLGIMAVLYHIDILVGEECGHIFNLFTQSFENIITGRRGSVTYFDQLWVFAIYGLAAIHIMISICMLCRVNKIIIYLLLSVAWIDMLLFFFTITVPVGILLWEITYIWGVWTLYFPSPRTMICPRTAPEIESGLREIDNAYFGKKISAQDYAVVRKILLDGLRL